MKSGKRLISSAVVFCYFQCLNLCFGCVCFPTFAKRIWSNLTFILFHNKGRGINWKSEFGHNIRQISAHPELFCSKGQSAWNISRYSNPLTDKFHLFSCISWLWLVKAERKCLANDLWSSVNILALVEFFCGEPRKQTFRVKDQKRHFAETLDGIKRSSGQVHMCVNFGPVLCTLCKKEQLTLSV